MSREFTLFQFDVDEDAVRRVLGAVPGVTPLPPDEHAPTDERRTPPGEKPEPSGDYAPGDPSTGTGSDVTGVTDESAGGSPGVEAHLDDRDATSEDRAGATKWMGPSTPWPGAPSDEEEDGGLLDRLRSNRTLLIGGLVAGLGLVGGIAVWFLKFRGDGDDADRTETREYHTAGRPGDASRTDQRPGSSAQEPPADDDESRSYPVDAAPVIGMAFLALATLVLRHVYAKSEG